MSDIESDPADHRRLVDAYWASFRQTSYPILQTLTDRQQRKEYSSQDRLLDEYAEWLPFVPVSRCPFSGNVLEYVFDPFGLDGMWWCPNKLADFPDPPESEHFRTLLGAVDFKGRQPVEAAVHFTVRPGPGAPFVVPQLLGNPTMRAVISQVSLAHGDTAYLTAYFSEQPVHGGFLHQPWVRNSYEVRDADGEYQGWSVSNEQWDFDIGPWIDRGLVRWIAPGDDELRLRQDRPCPFEGLTGARAPQVIERGQLYQIELPTGEQPDLQD